MVKRTFNNKDVVHDQYVAESSSETIHTRRFSCLWR